MPRSALLLASLILILSVFHPASQVLAEQDGVGSRLASKLGGFFKSQPDNNGDLNRALQPPGELIGSGSDNKNGQRFIVAQSKRELGAAINRNTRGIGDNSIRVQELQEQMRQITGRVEELVFELQRIQEQLLLMQEDAGLISPDDNVRRHADSSGESDTQKDGGEGSGAQLPANRETQTAQLPTAISPGIPDAESGAETGANYDKPLDLSTGVRVARESGDPLLSGGIASLGTLTLSPDTDPNALYNLGYSQLLNGDYDSAEGNLRTFVEVFPNDELAPNARYWLAETFYARGEFADAVEEFSITYKSHPQSNKAPDSLLKLGLSLARLNEHEAACATLAEMFDRFPDASRSVLIAARDGQIQSNCT